MAHEHRSKYRQRGYPGVAKKTAHEEKPRRPAKKNEGSETEVKEENTQSQGPEEQIKEAHT